MKHHGFTLVELLVGLIITVMLAALLTSVVVASARSARGHLATLDSERTRVTAMTWWRTDMRNAEQGDVSVPAFDQMVFHRPVGIAFVCGRDATNITIARADWRGDRAPDASRDEAWLLRDPSTEFWDEARVAFVTAASCPDGRTGWRLSVGAGASDAKWVEIVEPQRARIYANGGSSWLGLEPSDGSALIQPFAGPVAATSQFSLFGRDVQAVIAPSGSTAPTLVAPAAAP